MKSGIFSTFLSVALSVFILTGCSKDDETPDTTTTTTNEFSYDDSFGVFVAVKSISTQTVGGITIPVEVNTATAAFMESAGSSTLVDGGAVSINNKSLKKVQNNAYIYDDLLNPLDLSTITWTAAGNSNVPAINKTVNRGFPSFSGADALPASISKASGFSISLANKVSNADSVIIVVASNNKSAYKIVAGNAASVNFSSSDLSGVEASATGLVSVSPYNISTETISSKKYYFINESVYTKATVNITQ
ncbi:MAG: hypothetical protein CVU14_03750 [Bacteroidetes bacterium HGW-Bacteroidetes-9]|jgi:hypothetical protein|nr:MAG: hypothetical protein CVU14_03750 [Bacteroidetes bacterium HGW-Bacteroidetes-9]